MGKPPEQKELIVDYQRQRRKRPTASKKANDLDGRQWLKNSISIWSDISQTGQDGKTVNHPATFPRQLVSRLIQCYTRSDQNVLLDPFCGTGTAVIAAEEAGKLGIGLDISEQYVKRAEHRPSMTRGIFDEYNTDRTGQRRLIKADARELLQHVSPESVDLVITSPPYWDVLLRSRTADYKQIKNYGESTNDLGRISDYREFLNALRAVFTSVITVMKTSCYCCVIVMDLRKGSNFFPLHADLLVEMQEIGFLLDDIIIWDRRHEYNRMRPLGYPAVFRINKVHEYILIFQKPESDATQDNEQPRNTTS